LAKGRIAAAANGSSDLDPHTWFLESIRVSPQRYLDRFRRFCTIHPCDQQTDTQTDTQTTLHVTAVVIYHIYAMRPNNSNNTVAVGLTISIICKTIILANTRRKIVDNDA